MAVLRLLALCLLVACEPTIASSAYQCGPEKLCPDRQECSGSDDTCVTRGTESAFECEDDGQAGETPATGKMLAALSCTGLGTEIEGCLIAADTADWVQFDTPTNCTGVKIVARLKYSIAYQAVALRLSSDGTTSTIVGEPCTSGGDASTIDTCFSQVVEAGHHYALGAVLDGVDCDGDCAYNRFVLTLSIQAP